MGYTLIYTHPRTGEEHEIRIDRKHPRVTVGREVGNTIVIPDLTISRRHAKFEYQASNGLLRISNYSSHGTFVDDERLGRLATSHHVEVRIGEVLFEVLPDDAPPPDAPPPISRPADSPHIGIVQKHPTGLLILELYDAASAAPMMFKPGDPGYEELIEHVGGLKFNERKDVLPWAWLQS